MPKIVEYAEVKRVKSKQKRENKRLKKFFLIVLFLGLVVVVSGFLSGLFSFGGGSSTNLFSGLFAKKNQIASHSYYMVSMGTYNSLAEAESVASGTAVMGAGSYVWFYKSKFYVVGNIYKSISDAEAVYNNIKNTGNYEISVEEIPFKKLTINNSNYTAEQNQTVKGAITFIGSLYEKCYDYALRVDKSEVNTTLVSSELNSLKSEAKIYASKLDAINSYAVSELVLNTKNAYITIIDALDAAILKVIAGNSANSDLKYLVAQVVSAKYNLYQNI